MQRCGNDNDLAPCGLQFADILGKYPKLGWSYLGDIRPDLPLMDETGIYLNDKKGRGWIKLGVSFNS